MTNSANKRVVQLDQPFGEDEIETVSDRFEEEPADSAWVGYGYVERKNKLPTQLKIFYAPNADGPLTLRQPSKDIFELVSDDGEVVWTGTDLNDFFIENAEDTHH